ncbi:MAG: SulP family inorganic anion transporter, partial [Planctomycetes bacterium]|nr:SulP family inorganic anion transporter [Planctomycetota bacterium]
ESTLSVIAVDSIDPHKRTSPLNRDLFAAGVGNLVCASLGGLPMISEIVRSKANIDAGAQSSWANFYHGLLLLVFVAAAPWLLHMIPLAALGAMLVYTGTRLASPKEFQHAFHVGPDQLLLFTTTLIVTLATDLLVGVGAGLALKVLLHFGRGARFSTLFRARVEEQREGSTLRLKIQGSAAFTSLLAVRRSLGRVDSSIREVVIDLSDVVVVDHTFMTRVHGLAEQLPDATLELVGIDDMHTASQHPHAARRRRVS